MPGRLAEVTVEEGSSVTQGQVIARISSPEYEAQLRAAQADVQNAKDALAARRSGNHLPPERARIRQVRFRARAGADEDRVHHQAGVRAAQAQLRLRGRGGAELHLAEGPGAVQDQELGSGGRTHRIDHQRSDPRLAAARPGAISARARGRSGRGGGADRHHPRPHRRLHDDLPAGGGRRQADRRRRGAHRPRSRPRLRHSGEGQLRRRRRAVHAQDRRDQGRAGEADVPHQAQDRSADVFSSSIRG